MYRHIAHLKRVPADIDCSTTSIGRRRLDRGDFEFVLLLRRLCMQSQREWNQEDSDSEPKVFHKWFPAQYYQIEYQVSPLGPHIVFLWNSFNPLAPGWSQSTAEFCAELPEVEPGLSPP